MESDSMMLFRMKMKKNRSEWTQLTMDVLKTILFWIFLKHLQ